jgi:outer membrane murein-binding lipoprotein Lpp
MGAIIVSILGALVGNKVVMTIFAAVVGGLSLYVAGGINRAKKDKAATAAKDLAAAQDRLEMDREATAAERQVTGQTDAQAKQEAAPWVRH